jgi:hypothetical protein
MVRATSAAAHQAIKSSGLLSKRRQQVYDHIKNHGPCTAEDVSDNIEGGWKRCSELNDQGMIQRCGTAISPNTNTEVDVWKVTSRTIPLPLNKKACKCRNSNCAKRDNQIREVFALTEGPFSTPEAEELAKKIRNALRNGVRKPPAEYCKAATD